MNRTADSAPLDVTILVWVRDRDIRTGKPIGWRMGRQSYGRLYAEGMNGNWDITYWHPLPEDPK